MERALPAVLIVDDDQPTRALYERTIRLHYRVFACANEVEALEVLELHAIAVLILEPTLSSGNGWAFLSAVHLAPRTCHMPVVICTTVDARQHGMRLGAVRYLVKPVLPMDLLAVIQHLVPITST